MGRSSTSRRGRDPWIGARLDGHVQRSVNGVQDVQLMGGGVVLAVYRQGGSPSGSSPAVDQRGAFIAESAEGKLAAVTVYLTDIDEPRAAAEWRAREA
jgi:hypothetical protein